MHSAVAVHIAHMYGATVDTVAVDLVMALALSNLADFHLFVAMMLVFDHSVYLHTTMMHMGYGYCCFGLGGKNAHQGYCYYG